MNKVHNRFEEAAKKLHPKVSIPSVLLKYETAVGESRPKTPSLAQFTKAVVDKMTSIRDNALRSESADNLQPGNIKIGSDTISKFHNKWVAAIGVHAYSSLCVKYQYATAAASEGLNWSIQVVSPPGESKIIDEQYLPDINAASSQDFWLGMFPVMEPRKRQRVTRT